MFRDAGPLEMWRASHRLEKLAIAMQLLGLAWAVYNLALLVILASIPVLVALYRLAEMRALVAKPEEWWDSVHASEAPAASEQPQEQRRHGGSLGDFR